MTTVGDHRNPMFRDSNWRSAAQEEFTYDGPVHRDHYWRDSKPRRRRSRNRTPEIRSDARVGITLLTREDVHAGSALIVESQVYTAPVDREHLNGWVVGQHLRHPSRNDEAVILVVEGYADGLGDLLKGMIPRYPRYLNSIARDRKIRHPFVPAESGYGQCDVAFVFGHRGGDGYARSEERDGESSDAARETWVGAWVGSIHHLQTNSAQQREYRPVIVLLFPPYEDKEDLNHSGKLMTNQYQDHKHLFLRLKYQSLFIFMDLYRTFTKWELIARRITRYCEDSEKECFNRVSRVIPRVADLHRNLAHLYLIRQQLHNHELARRRFHSLVSTLPDPRNIQIATNDVQVQKQRLKDRLTDIEDEHSDKLLLLDTLKERFQNLVDLEFNVASAKTNVRVAAISVLAFAIAPVGFVASIFGITTMSVPVKWFVVSGAIVAVVSIIVWFCIDRYYSNVESQVAERSLFDGTGRKKRRGKSDEKMPEYDTRVQSFTNTGKGYPEYDAHDHTRSEMRRTRSRTRSRSGQV